MKNKQPALLMLALRGLTRNRRRSLVTFLAIMLGYAGISLFAGYTHNIYRGLELQAIHGELLGHLTVQKPGMSREGKLDPERYMLNGDEIERIRAIASENQHVRLVAPRMTISGLLSNGRVSTIFVAEGIQPEAARQLRQGLAVVPALAASRNVAGGGVETLDADNRDTVAIANGLAGLMKLDVGDTGAVLVNTLGGQANASDIVVGGIFNTGNASTNDLAAFMPLELVRYLYDAEGRADRLSLLLDDTGSTAVARADLEKRFADAGLALEIQSWDELSSVYRQVREMFNMIFGFIFLIVLTVVAMSVINSMGMAVVERTREIGTLRAIGLRQRGVTRLFTSEAGLLLVIGCGVGFAVTMAVRAIVNAAGISYVPPNQVAAVPLLIDMDERMIVAAVVLAVVGLLAALIPARRAAHQPIINALGHV